MTDFNISTLAAGFFFGVIGLWMLREGRRKGNMWSVGIGLGLMIYPYFVERAWLTWSVGFALCFVAYHFWE